MTISYEDYLTCHGSKLTEANFWEYTDEAVQRVRSYTSNRLPAFEKLEAQEPEVYAQVKKCIYKVADKLLFYSTTAVGTGIASESTDGHSVNFVTISADQQRSEIYAVVRQYLFDTGLLYGGYNPFWDDRTW